MKREYLFLFLFLFLLLWNLLPLKGETKKSDLNDKVTLVAFGRTGAGKSSLANKISGQKLFKEGHTLTAETFEAESKSFPWPKDNTIKVNYVDTPGFADNRAETDNMELLANVLKFLKNLKGGFNIGMYFLPAKTRVDAHDIEELKILGMLLGHEVFAHTWIVITQINTQQEDLKKENYRKIPEELPAMLAKHGFKGFTRDKIIFADFNDFDNQFLVPMHNLVQYTSKFEPQIPQDLDTKEGMAKAMASPAMQGMMKHYEEMFKTKAEELKRMNELFEDQAKTNKLYREQAMKRDEEIKKLNDKIENMKSMQKGGESSWQDYIPVIEMLLRTATLGIGLGFGRPEFYNLLNNILLK